MSIPWWSIIRGAFVIGAQITFLGSFGIVTLGMTEGWEAAGLYLLYVPAIIAFFATCILLFISIAICTYSFQWARRIVCLFAFVLLPHFAIGMLVLVSVFQGRWFDPALMICSVLLLVPAVYWSRGLYRFEKENKWLSGIWGFANKYVKNNSGAKKRLKKLIDDFSKPPPLISETIKKRFRRS